MLSKEEEERVDLVIAVAKAGENLEFKSNGVLWLAEKLKEVDGELKNLKKSTLDLLMQYQFCPVHMLPLYYHKPSNTYACQDSACKYSHGVRFNEIDYS